MALLKKDLIVKVAEQLNITKKDTKIIIDKFFDAIYDYLSNKKDLKISGFGKFTNIELKKTKTRCLHTKKILKHPKRNVVRFKPFAKLKQSVK